MKLFSSKTGIGILFVLPILLAGCQPSRTSQPTTEANGVELRVADAQDFERLLESQRGKIVVVDFWATWCGPCVKMFPHTVQLANKYDSDEVVVIAVSMDDPDDEESVREFLEKQESRFQNLLSSYGVGSAGFDAFEIPNGAIPHFRVYNQLGDVVFASSTQEGLEAQVEELMN